MKRGNDVERAIRRLEAKRAIRRLDRKQSVTSRVLALLGLLVAILAVAAFVYLAMSAAYPGSVG